jgi:hypothetical protein
MAQKQIIKHYEDENILVADVPVESGEGDMLTSVYDPNTVG